MDLEGNHSRRKRPDCDHSRPPRNESRLWIIIAPEGEIRGKRRKEYLGFYPLVRQIQKPFLLLSFSLLFFSLLFFFSLSFVFLLSQPVVDPLGSQDPLRLENPTPASRTTVFVSRPGSPSIWFNMATIKFIACQKFTYSHPFSWYDSNILPQIFENLAKIVVVLPAPTGLQLSAWNLGNNLISSICWAISSYPQYDAHGQFVLPLPVASRTVSFTVRPLSCPYCV